MKSTPALFILLFFCAALVGCNEKEQTATPDAEPAKADSTDAGETVTEKADTAMKGLLSSDDPREENGMAQISKISGYSDVISSGWDSIKGMDFSQKDAFLKQLKGIASKAKSNIGMLKQISPMITGASGKGLIESIKSLSGSAGNLSDLVKKGSSITSGDWGSYKDQVGTVIKSLSGGFSGLSSLVN